MSMTAFATVALLATRPAFTARPWRHLPSERAPPPPSGTAEADLIAAASSSAPGRRPSPSVHPRWCCSAGALQRRLWSGAGAAAWSARRALPEEAQADAAA
jgi:hypothetical protein